MKISFKLFNKRQEVELTFEEFGKYVAAAYACDYSDDVKCKKFTDEFLDKYSEIPFTYNGEEYGLALIMSDDSLEIHKKNDDDFEKYSNFNLINE